MSQATALASTRLEAPFGALIENFDFGVPPTSETVSTIRQALARSRLLIFRGHERVSDSSLVEFARAFGELIPWFVPEQRSPEAPELVLVSNVREGDRPIGIADNSSLDWHTNYCYRPRVASLSLLEALEVPERGGSTMFSDTYAAYEGLRPSVREQLEELEVHHSLKGYAGSTPLGDEARAQQPEAIHRAVRIGETARQKCLYDLAPRSFVRFVGLDEDRGKRLLQTAFEASTNPDIVYEHHWLPGDLVLWDSHGTLHARRSFTGRRTLRRLDIAETGTSGYPPP